MVCPICGEYSHFIFTKFDHKIFECSDCAHQYVQESPPTSDCADDNRGKILPDKILRDRAGWYTKLLTKYMQPGRVLYFDETMKTAAFENIASVEKFDLVAMIQVLPHFHDMESALSAAANATTENGYWLVEICNRNSWTARLLGRRWQEYSPPSVVRWFAPYDLNLVAARFGFAPVAAGRPKFWVKGEHAKSLLRQKLSAKSALGKALSKVVGIIPNKLWLPYPSEDLHWALFQKVRPVQSATVPWRTNSESQVRAAE